MAPRRPPSRFKKQPCIYPYSHTCHLFPFCLCFAWFTQSLREKWQALSSVFTTCTTTNTCIAISSSSSSYICYYPSELPLIASSSHHSSRARRKKEKMSSSSNLETRSIIDELRNFDKNGLFDLGHPLLNRIAESFVKAAGIGAVQAVTREVYLTAVEGAAADASGIPPEISAAKRHGFPNLRGETNAKTVEALVKGTGKESLQWGLAAGMYSGLTYGLKEARGVHDWKNSALAGAVTGAALALTSDGHSHEQIVQCAITGAALSTAANLLTGIF